MKPLLAASAAALVALSSPAFSQTGTTTPPNTDTNTRTSPNGAGTDAGTMPESMRIQQQIDKQVSRNPQDLITKRNSTTTNAPGSSGSPVEHNRLDPAAPSPQRLQIDEGASARARNNPDVESTHPNASGNSYNTIIQGSPSNNATTSSGGLGSTTTTPGASSSSSPSASGSSSGTAGSGTSGSAGGASSGGGSSGGGGH